ncbi:MAG: hypothetical protein AAF288_12895 [Planctomycetota bacterium]
MVDEHEQRVEGSAGYGERGRVLRDADAKPDTAGMGVSVTPHAQVTGPRDFRFLGAGYDTLDLGLYVDWGVGLMEVQEQWDYCRDNAVNGEIAIWRHGVVDQCEIKPSGKRNYRWFLRYPGFVAWVAQRSTPDRYPNVYVSPSAQSLWLLGVDGAVETIANWIAELGGTLLRVQVSRVDMTADFAIPDGPSTEWLKSAVVGRSKKTKQYETECKLETFYVGKRGAPIQGRIYDKALQMRSAVNSRFLTELWGGEEPAWRVEFQLRRSKLRQLEIDSLDDLRKHGAWLWRYLTEDWLTLRLPDNPHTSRRSLHPWWQAIQHCHAEFGGTGTRDGRCISVPKAPVEWYVAHISGCLVTFAARERLRKLPEAIDRIAKCIAEYWDTKSWPDALTKRHLELGQADGEASDVPF